MSVEASIEDLTADLLPVELAAARGELPDWARAKPARREHMARVAGLLEVWASDLGLGEVATLRWAAAGWLHDSLRDADPVDLVHHVGPAERDLPPALLHGPAAAARLRGLVSPEVEAAVRYHTLGHPILGELGRAVYVADYLEPGRPDPDERRAALRRRMPGDRLAVLVEVADAKLRHLLDRRLPVRPETASFWSELVAETRK
jgi:HD superfamily phosphohydrolase YqeK